MEENNEELELNIGFEGAEENEILGITEFAQAEWVFQFDNDEPVTIAWSTDEDDPGELTFTMKANSGSTIGLMSPDGSKVLRLYARELTPERKEYLNSPEYRLSQSSGN